MRTHRALALGLLSGILAACGQAGGPGAGTAGPSETTGASGGFQTEVALGDVRMSAGRATDPGGELVVEYALRNDGRDPVLVLDRVPPTLGSAVLPQGLDPERAWVFMADSRIRVSKQGFDPAPGVRFIAAPVLGARLLEPGGSLEGRARAALPPVLDVPGPEFDAPRSPVDAGASELEFCVQLAGSGQGRPSGVDPTVLEVPSAAPGPEELICSPPLGPP